MSLSRHCGHGNAVGSDQLLLVDMLACSSRLVDKTKHVSGGVMVSYDAQCDAKNVMPKNCERSPRSYVGEWQNKPTM